MHRHRVLSLSAPAGRVETSDSLCPRLSVRHRGWGCSCPPAGCQGYPDLNSLLRRPDYRLSSPGLLPALAITDSHFCCLLSDLSSDAFSPLLSHWHLPLIPCANLAHRGLSSFFSCPRAGVPYFNQRKKNLQTYKHARVSKHTHTQNTHAHTYTHMHTHTNAHTYMHLFSLSLSLSLHQPDLSSNTFPLE